MIETQYDIIKREKVILECVIFSNDMAHFACLPACDASTTQESRSTNQWKDT